MPFDSIFIISTNTNGKILRHLTTLNDLNHNSLNHLATLGSKQVLFILVFLVIELGSLVDTTSPSEDGGHGVGASLLAILMHSPMLGDSAMSGLTLEYFAISTDEDGRHETKRTKALSNGVTLDITVVILACPNEFSVASQTLSDHIVDETVFVLETVLLELLLECVWEVSKKGSWKRLELFLKLS